MSGDPDKLYSEPEQLTTQNFTADSSKQTANSKQQRGQRSS